MTPQKKSFLLRLARTLLVAAALAGALVLGFVAMLWLADRALAEPVDKVAAIVENEIILKSEVDEQLAIYAAQEKIAESDTTSLRKLREHILGRMVDEKVVLAEAKKQGITVPESELDSAVNDAIEETKQRIGSEEQFTLELNREGLTLDMLRERYRGEVQKQMLQSRLVGKEIRSKVQVQDADVDAYFEKHKAELPKKPEQVHLRHILIQPRPDASAIQAAREKAVAARARITAGEDFAKVAAEVSQDPSAKVGGDIGRVGKGDLEAVFDSTVFAIEVGAVSEPVRTSRGWHLIRVDERDAERARVRHIVVTITVGQADKDAASALANDVRQRAAAGEPFEELARRYSDEEDVRDQGGDLGNLPMKALRENYLAAIDKLAPGQVSNVVFDDRGFHIFQMVEVIPEQDYALEEIRKELQQLAYQEKLEAAYEEWVAGLRKNYFVEIREG